MQAIKAYIDRGRQLLLRAQIRLTCMCLRSLVRPTIGRLVCSLLVCVNIGLVVSTACNSVHCQLVFTASASPQLSMADCKHGRLLCACDACHDITMYYPRSLNRSDRVRVQALQCRSNSGFGARPQGGFYNCNTPTKGNMPQSKAVHSCTDAECGAGGDKFTQGCRYSRQHSS